MCSNDLGEDNIWARKARAAWKAFAAIHSTSTPGQLMERAILEDKPGVVAGIIDNTDLNINQPCDSDRYSSVSPFMIALRNGRAEIIEIIVSQPAFKLKQSLPEYEPWTWLPTSSLAVLRQYLQIPGSDVNQQDGNGKALLHEVVYDHATQDKLMEILSQPGINIEVKQLDGSTPLYRAGLAGNVPAFQALLVKGADINNYNNDNHWTILMCAVAQNYANIAKITLQCVELKVNAADVILNTALHLAAERGHIQLVEMLLQHPKIKINLKNNMGWTALSKAAFNGHTKAVSLLLARPDLEPNFVDQKRQTPVFHAASAGNIEIVKLLISNARTNVAISNRPARQTAFDIAIALGFTEISSLLNSHALDKDELSPGDTYVETSFE